MISKKVCFIISSHSIFYYNLLATRIVEQPIPTTVADTKVIIKNIYAGLQASDIMISNGAVLY